MRQIAGTPGNEDPAREKPGISESDTSSSNASKANAPNPNDPKPNTSESNKPNPNDPEPNISEPNKPNPDRLEADIPTLPDLKPFIRQSNTPNSDRSDPDECGGEEPAFVRRKAPVSSYLVACEEDELREYQKQLLFDVLGPIFFGRKQAASREELAELFRARYGIDVDADFCEGDDHFEEYREAQEAIAEGMSIYAGQIAFGDSVLAELAGVIWEDLERQDGRRFRRINTMLEE
ncbi:MAG: hypothetical protein LUG93_04425 [Lachnospiraceae bacterium]|nr:hypothetical protein [Lachnospiraceae bacterium]